MESSGFMINLHRKKRHNSLSRKRGSFGYSQLTYFVPEQKDPLQYLVQESLSYLKRYIKNNEPFKVNNIPKQKVKGDAINLSVKLSKLSVACGGDFIVDDITTDPSRMLIRYKINLPIITVSGLFAVKGKEQGTKVKTKGNFRIGLYNSKVTGRASLLVIEGKIYLKRLDIDYSINHNLKVEDITMSGGVGMTEVDLYELLPHVMFLYLEENEKLICFALSVQISDFANIKLSTRTVRGALKWLSEE